MKNFCCANDCSSQKKKKTFDGKRKLYGAMENSPLCVMVRLVMAVATMAVFLSDNGEK